MLCVLKSAVVYHVYCFSLFCMYAIVQASCITRVIACKLACFCVFVLFLSVTAPPALGVIMRRESVELSFCKAQKRLQILSFYKAQKRFRRLQKVASSILAPDTFSRG